jgi:hypothetical protein
MPLKPFAITTFCDDIRYEIGGKYSLIGVYRDSLIFQGGTFPITLARLGLSITFVEPPSASIGDIDIHVLLPGDTREKPSFLFKVQPQGGQSVHDAPEGSRRVVNFHLILGPLIVKESGPIKVRLVKGGQRYRAGVLQVQTAQAGTQPQAVAQGGGELPANPA